MGGVQERGAASVVSAASVGAWARQCGVEEIYFRRLGSEPKQPLKSRVCELVI